MTDGNSARKQRSWEVLRLAIADDLIEKLPPTIPLDELPQLLSVPEANVARAVEDGDIVTVSLADGLSMVTAESFRFLAGELHIRLPLPSGHPHGAGVPDGRSVAAARTGTE